MTSIVNYQQGYVFVHLSEMVRYGSVLIFQKSDGDLCVVSKEIRSTNYLVIPFSYGPGKYQVHIRIENEETIKNLIIT